MIQLAKRVGSIKQVKNLLAHRATGDGPINFIDVGSAGNLPKPWIDHPDQIGEILKFEPRGGQEKHDNITMVETALWSAEETRPLYIYIYAGGFPFTNKIMITFSKTLSNYESRGLKTLPLLGSNGRV